VGVYGTGNKNRLAEIAVTETAKTWCLKSVTYCYGNATGSAPANGQANGVVVSESAAVPTTFARLFGIDAINVSAKSTACGMCGSQPFDIAVVVDRTGSMAGNMGDLKNGVKTFLQALDPKLDYVTLLALPPAVGSDPCSPPTTDVLYPTDNYLLVPIGNDYKTPAGDLNTSSNLLRTIDCMQPGGATSYKQALAAAQDQLVNHGSGRPNVQRVIVFESDGAANTVPLSYMSGLLEANDPHRDDVLRPCGSAVDYSTNTIRPSGTTVFTVAYALQRDDDCYQAPHFEQVGGKWTFVGYKAVREATSAGPALTAIADPGNAVAQATETDMSASFQKIANKLLGARLMPDSEAG
jgi:hypothetical protein